MKDFEQLIKSLMKTDHVKPLGTIKMAHIEEPGD